MDGLAKQSLSSIRGSGIPVETKLKQLTELKAEIKHRHCPDNAIAPLFDVIRVSLATPHLTDAGFSILGHLIKRLELQDQGSIIQAQGAKTYPVLLDKLADPKDRIRHRAAQAFTDFHAVSSVDVEHFVRDHVLASRNPRAKEAGMHWVAQTRKEKNIPFRAFVPHLVDCLEDADGSVRQTAQAIIIDLFQNANTRGTNDLQKHLQQRNVRKSIVDHILSSTGLYSSLATDPPSPIDRSASLSSKQTNHSGGAVDDHQNTPEVATPISVAEQEAANLDPIYIESPREVDEVFREMQPYFEGKETEQNWLKREKSILKLRKITKGNAPQDFITNYLACIKSMLDGILKTVNSLRTTLCTIGCHLLQDIARAMGSGLDNMVEILLQNLIKLCASTKKIAAAKGNDTVTAIMANVSCSIRLTQHIYLACQDKNVQPRNYACGWLKVIINKHGHHKTTIEHAGGLDLLEKCLKAGLVDRDPNVRESMRPTYWAFARRWPEKSEAMLYTLDERNQKALINSSANPNPHQQWTAQPTAAGGKSAFSQSTSSVPQKPSIKETIAAQKRAVKAAGKNLPSRPGSAEPFSSPKKSASQMNLGRPATFMSTASRNVSTTSVGTLSSAPVRPRRRADPPRPATADPHAPRKFTKTETPPRSPAVSPVKRVKTPAPTASSVKPSQRKVDSPASTGNMVKGNAHAKQFGLPDRTRPPDVAQPHFSPTKAAEDFTMVIPNLSPPANAYTISPERSSQPGFPPSSTKISKLDDPFSPIQSDNNQDVESPERIPRWHDVPSNNQRPHTSPSKLAQQFGRISVNEDENTRISMSPRAIGSRKENLQLRSPYGQGQNTLKVYEDPVHPSTNGSPHPSSPISTPRALEELPVNEPVKNRQALDHQLLAEEPQDPEYHRKWLAMEEAERRRLSGSENVENPHMARKILDSAIGRLKAKSLDVQGFRKLQALIRTSKDAVWEDGYKFDEIIMPLLEYLETSSEELPPRSGKTQDLKAQTLVTIRLLLQFQAKYFLGYYPRALTAILTARKHYNSTSHIVCGLEETAESVVHHCDPIPCIDLVMDLLEEQGNSVAEKNTILMGLYVLAGLLHGVQEKGLTLQLNDVQQARLGNVGAKYLVDTNPDLRRGVIEFVLELHDTVEQDRFWPLVASGRDDHRSLITYYLARKRAIMQ